MVDYEDDRFCWDAEKNEANFQSHGIYFEDVVALFYVPAAYFDATRKEYGEVRTLAIGCIEEVPVVVIFTERNGKVRIISARPATSKEHGRFKEFKKRWRAYFRD